MAELKNAKRSTNARQRGPKAADQKGAIGSALAIHILQVAEEDGKREAVAQTSRKDLLRKIMGFRDNAEHIAFRKVFDDKLTEIKKSADAAKLTLNAYTDANPIAATQRVAVSRWTKLSSAVEHGFPRGGESDLDKPWPEIEKAATAHLDERATSSGKGGSKKNGGPKQRAGRKAKGVVKKMEEFIKSNLRDANNVPLPKDNRNLAQLIGTMLIDASMDELREVAAVVQRQMEVREAADKKAAEATAKASADAKKLHDATMKGTSKRKVGQHKAEGPSVADKLIADAAKAQNYDPKTDSKLRDGTVVKNVGKAKAKAKA